MGMSPEGDEFPLGSFVVVRQGKHAGSVFVVIGFGEKTEKNGRILIADGRKISVSRPKRKNPRHVETTGVVSREVAQRIEGGKSLDDGWLAQIISSPEKIDFTSCS
jgi:ribosomal protein L14E/L6E/L27E